MKAVKFEYWTIKETAEKWGVSPRRVNELCRCDRIYRAVKVGGHWLIPKGTKQPLDGRTLTHHYLYGTFTKHKLDGLSGRRS